MYTHTHSQRKSQPAGQTEPPGGGRGVSSGAETKAKSPLTKSVSNRASGINADCLA